MKYLLRAATLCALALSVSLPPTTHANTLRRILFGSRDQSDTVLLELDYAAKSRMTALPNQVLEIRLEGTEVPPDFATPSVPADLSVVKSVAITQDGDSSLILQFQLSQEAEPSAWTLSAHPWQYVVNLVPKAVNRRANPPQWIPGDRPIRTKYADSDMLKKGSPSVLLSRISFSALLAAACMTGAGMMFIVLRILDRATLKEEQKHGAESPGAPPARELTDELSEDINHLMRTAHGESNAILESAAAAEERVRLVLKMMREGREVASIAKALELTPDQVREILERNS